MTQVSGQQDKVDRHAEFVKMVERHLTQAKVQKLNGEITFRALIRDGGIMDSYKESKERQG